ncbi:MAG: glycosyl hydrolase [Candidatus Roizmanbacteria bacterium]|nr:glycosyl hydrolase [Candidatus Roizmanbacteria bacterium]
MIRRLVMFMVILVIATPLFFYSFQYFSRASAVKANIIVDINKVSGPFPDRWKALAQGGEESGVRMLANVVSKVSGLYPKYIRLDHIYDFYDVVTRNSSGNIIFDFSKLDETVCDIYHTGAKPFFSLGYMPPTMSDDGSLIGKPKNWNEWSFLVQKTVERYSSKDSVLPCGALEDFWKTDIYYEVWNEPDLESFGKWKYTGAKSYSGLYFYSVKGASHAQNILPYKIGGPVTTALYKNWIQKFLDYIIANNLRIDFLSWHHYSKKTNDYTQDIININKWLGEDPKYDRYENLPKIISEWGYDSEKNPIADTEVGAAHTIASLRNLINAGLELSFLFEIKDGPTLSWGILTYQGQEKPRYKALKMLDTLEGNQLIVDGEGSNVSAIASKTEEDKIALILTNYDESGRNYEAVPVTFKNLDGASYKLTKTYLDGRSEVSLNLKPAIGELKLNGERSIIMPANTIVVLELFKVE